MPARRLASVPHSNAACCSSKHGSLPLKAQVVQLSSASDFDERQAMACSTKVAHAGHPRPADSQLATQVAGSGLMQPTRELWTHQ
jgi:hypothetical protein